MFRSFVYLNEEKMYSYLRQIDKEVANRPLETSTRRTRGGSLGVSGININVEKETEEKRNNIKDVHNDYDKFEKKFVSIRRRTIF